MIEIDKRIGRPQNAAQLLPADWLTWLREQHLQNAQRLLLQPDPDALLAQFAGARIQLERAETNRP
jgi:hypothetical protein